MSMVAEGCLYKFRDLDVTFKSNYPSNLLIVTGAFTISVLYRCRAGACSTQGRSCLTISAMINRIRRAVKFTALTVQTVRAIVSPRSDQPYWSWTNLDMGDASEEQALAQDPLCYEPDLAYGDDCYGEVAVSQAVSQTSVNS